ncbi:MAG TPA: PD-(D/E)XK nuclease family protein [Steroidobacter sp.]|nr:PD-(D/E)XK nuclease family protein [Steroidobacter sp.]
MQRQHIALSLYELLDRNVGVLTASRRLAHALRVGYAHYARERGRMVWRTPVVLPWTAWLREQWREARASDSARPSQLLTSAQTRVIWEEVVARSSCGAGLLNPVNAARLAARSWRRMQEHCIAVEQLEGELDLEARALHEWCAAFVRRCDDLNALDEARLPAWALERRLIPIQPVALAGFDFLPPALARLAAIWRDAEKLIDASAERGRSTDVLVFGAADSDEELEAAARWARACLEERGGTVGVLAPDLQARRAQMQRVFEDVFAPGARCTGAEICAPPVAIAAPQPLAEYPIVDAALLVLALAAGEGDALITGRLLRSPFIGGGVAESAGRALADFRLREQQRDCRDWFELERLAAGACVAQLTLAARAVNALLRGAPSAMTPSRRAEQLQAILRAAGWPGERTLNSAEQQTVQKFQAALAELGSLDALIPRMTLQRAVAQLRALLRDTPFEVQTPAAAVMVIDPQTAAGMRFDALWVMGLDANRSPGGVNPDPLLPIGVQRAADMPEASAAGALQLANAQFDRWLRSAERVVLSWPRRDGDAELEPSPLLAHWPVCELPALTLSPVRSLRLSLFEQRPMLETCLDAQAPALSSQPARGGARTLELQSRCPFRAQAELRLHAVAAPAIGPGVDPRQRGKILHRVLEELWGTLKDRTTLAAKHQQELAAQVRELAERAVAYVLNPTSERRARLAALETDNVVQLVLRLLEAERARPHFRVHQAESAQSWSIAGLEITLRADRIDELQDGGALLIDYKLGDSHRPREWLDAWPGRPRRPQLPLYALAYGDRLRALAYAVLSPGAVEYRGWSDGAAVAPGVRTFPQGVRPREGAVLPQDWAALLEHWRGTLTELAQQYVAGEARVDPLPQECAMCHLSAFCRVHDQMRPESGAEDGDDAAFP